MDSFDIEFGGATWGVARPTRGARDVLDKLVAEAAWAEVEALQALAPRAFQTAATEYVRAAGAGEYRAGGKGWLAVVNGPKGNTLFLLALLREKHPAATAADARALIAGKKEAVEAALAVLGPRFFGLLAELPDTPPEYLETFRLMAGTAPPPGPST
jgi:hypothetical protein